MHYVFGEYSLDPTQYALRQAGRLVPIEPRVFEVLAYLVQHAGQTITTEALLAHLYPDQFAPVERLTNAVTHARKALGETSQAPRYIQTVRRRGYRFVAPVEVRQAADPDASPQPPLDRLGTVEPPGLDQTAVAPSQGVPPAAAPPVPVRGPGPGAAGADRPPAERRQLTVLCCALVDATHLAGQLDPEDLREVLHAYHGVCRAVIQRFAGHIAQYLGDGLLVYFGYPQAHEDDAQRAVRSGLGLVDALATLNTQLERERGVRLALRLGIHTGLVVINTLSGEAGQEPLAFGDTPHIAARLPGLAAPNTVVMSERTRRLVGGTFDVEDLGVQAFHGVAAPLRVYRLRGESAAESRFDAASARGLTPFIGREGELGLVLQRWQQVQAGEGQVVLLTGEAGIGKSRLLQTFTERIAAAPHIRLRYQCSPYDSTSAFYPIIAQLERAAGLVRDEPSAQKLAKLEVLLAQATARVPDVAPLLAALLSIPTAARYPPLDLSPQRQKEQTIAALVDQVIGVSRRQPVVLLFEDAHWSDPTSLDVLARLVHRVHDARVLAVITSRRPFEAPWTAMSHVTGLTLPRLSRPQSAAMVAQRTAGKALPQAVLEQLLTKTDGVPLFVEELTTTVLESGLLCEGDDHYALTGPLPALAIPPTVQDALMAQLDRLAPGKEIAQLGAVIGREFTYEVLAAVAPGRDAALVDALHQLVVAGLLFGDGVPPAARYRFKHALVRDAAYASLLTRTRQQYHQRIAQALETRFPTIVETQPELLAQHYTEAGCTQQGVDYWQRAGEHASARSAHREAISHWRTGIALLATLPATPAQIQQAVTLYIALGAALIITQGMAAPDVAQAFTQARALCQQGGEPSQLAPVLLGLWRFYHAQSQFHPALEIGETLLHLARHTDDPALAVLAHYALGCPWLWLGALAVARRHLEDAIARDTPDQRRAPMFRMGQDLGVACRFYAAQTLWLLGYPAQARARLHEALTLAQAQAHPLSLAWVHCRAASFFQCCRDVAAVQEHAEAAVALTTKQGATQWLAQGTVFQGWALAMQGQGEVGLAQVQQAITAVRAGRQTLFVPYLYTVLADVCTQLGHPAEGLQALAEAQTLVEQQEERCWEAEIARLRGVVLLRQPVPQPAEAEPCLQRALEVARRQEAKAFELRAATSLSRLWQQQGKCAEAYELLAPIYGWFTEGFDTADLQEAKALLAELAG